MHITQKLLPEQKEHTRHGKVTFPIQKYTTTLSQEVPAVTPHWHDEAEFTWITEGYGNYQIQLEDYRVCAGDLIFIAPLQLHSITKQTPQMQSETYVFHMNFLSAGANDVCMTRYLAPMMNQQLIPPFLIGKSHPIYADALDLFFKINTAWEQKNPGFELMIKAHLLSLAALLLPYCVESSHLPQLQTEHTQKVKNALEYIAEHFTENISIADIAATCYFSEYHFMRFFKKYIGMSCVEYIKNLRLEKAAELLENGEQSILDASLAAGFHNLPYFYREFKKKYGMTPKQFIKRN